MISFAAVIKPILSWSVLPPAARAAAERCSASPIPFEEIAKLFECVSTHLSVAAGGFPLLLALIWFIRKFGLDLHPHRRGSAKVTALLQPPLQSLRIHDIFYCTNDILRRHGVRYPCQWNIGMLCIKLFLLIM